ncbi:aldehyde dehydrogenase (NADP(+)) [Citricoccus sp. GCM10030269]|uniref:aldehyde dehydrogenase (NADP(+)) n=1 Tax=Citricoccus sp. GCM10030269 TaxID=3273388 RepID=UPI00361F6545
MINGSSLIAGQEINNDDGVLQAVNPATGERLEPQYSYISKDELNTAATAAARAFRSFRASSPEARAGFLESVASNLESQSEPVVERGQLETGLPEARLRGELARTTGQLRMFAGLVRSGIHHGARIDPALPHRSPAPRVDLRQRRIPLGPVAVFGASNFPLAFSVAGGDTASALAAGCPVIVKAHNSHPGLSELVGRAITAAVSEHHLDPGVFSLVYGRGSDIGQALVAHPAIKAVGFTGSRSGGTALMNVAHARPEPIPVYAEMSAINPVLVFDGALQSDLGQMATGFIDSLTASSGQLCTAPGLVFVPAGELGDQFVANVGDELSARNGQTMLSSSIAQSWTEGVEELRRQDGVVIIGTGQPGQSANAPGPVVFSTTAEVFCSNKACHAEIFGAAALIVRYAHADDLHQSLDIIEGQLTATLRMTESDHVAVSAVLPVLEEKVGRIIVNGWPTGVEVGHAVIHGGPYPATSDSRSTSVGSAAIDRFLRPVSYQDFPEELLPEPTQDANPWNVQGRLKDGLPEAR